MLNYVHQLFKIREVSHTLGFLYHYLTATTTLKNLPTAKCTREFP